MIRKVTKVTIGPVDTDTIREQRMTLFNLIDMLNSGGYEDGPAQSEHLDGLVNLIDHILDVAEGYESA